MNLDELLHLTEKIKNTIYTLKFKENDARKAYFEVLYSIINEYYKGRAFYEICKYYNEVKVDFVHSHLKIISQNFEHNILAEAYNNELNRKMLLDTFTNFETTINLCFEEVISEIEKNEMCDDLNRKLLKLAKSLSTEEYDSLIIELRKSTFIPLHRKFRFLAKRIDHCYTGEYKNDIEFLEFCTKLRNSFSHSGGLYFGKDSTYIFKDVEFIFKHKEFLVMEGENPNIILQINEKMTDIMFRLFNCLRNIEFIRYPDDGF
ncbi:MAG: hypothetical protein ACN6N7_08915 [Chryseobacterium culicis]